MSVFSNKGQCRLLKCPSPGNGTSHQQTRVSFSLKQGTVGFENQVNKCLELAEYLYTKIKNREEFEMVFNGEVSCHHVLNVYSQKIYWGKLLKPYFPTLPKAASELLFLCILRLFPSVSMNFSSSSIGMTSPLHLFADKRSFLGRSESFTILGCVLLLCWTSTIKDFSVPRSF